MNCQSIARFTPVTAFALAAAIQPAVAQSTGVVTRTLSAPVELQRDFTKVAAVRELRDGRVLITDSREKVLAAGDFTTRGVTTISRPGEGPEEYGTPTSLFAVGDSTWLQDPGNRRFLIIDAVGRTRGTAQYPERDASGRIPRTPPSFVDKSGRQYYLVQTMVGAPGATSSDDLPIIRLNPGTGSIETLASIPNPMVIRRTADGGMTGSISAAPFGGRDAWVITESGDVAVLRAQDYHVDWNIAGVRTSGAPISYEKIPVTEADKSRWRTERAKMPVTSMGVGNSAPPVNVADPEWPQYKGAFGEVLASPAGDLWVQRYGHLTDPPSYDVIDKKGNRIAAYVFPISIRLVGFGNGVVYAVRKDDNDLEYVQ